jgi:enoyl-CoA hydratase/carnithine racemase
MRSTTASVPKRYRRYRERNSRSTWGSLRTRRTAGAARAARALLNISPSLEAAGLLETALAAGADPVLSPLSGHPYLLVDLGRPATLRTSERDALCEWLNRQACPVIGLAGDVAVHPLACACDVLARDAQDAAALIANIEAAPLAALVLVQLLRVTAAMPISQALIAESLAYATLQAGPEFRRWLGSAPRVTATPEPAGRLPVLIERQGPHLNLRLNRPERRNALSVGMRDALFEALELAIADRSITGVTISGAGASFSAGGELAEFGSAPDPATAHAVRSTRSIPALLGRCADRLTFRVHGAAVGAGVEMAAFGRRIEATADAFFQLPEIRYGLIPGSGGCVSLPRRIGRQRTAYLALSAQRLDARTALAWGLIDALQESKSATRAAHA